MQQREAAALAVRAGNDTKAPGKQALSWKSPPLLQRPTSSPSASLDHRRAPLDDNNNSGGTTCGVSSAGGPSAWIL